MLSPIRAIAHHLRRHVGAGILCSVGYFDPSVPPLPPPPRPRTRSPPSTPPSGNWSVDIQAGSTFGYRPMLFVILLSGIMAVLFQVFTSLLPRITPHPEPSQVLATRLGCVTGLDLAAHCRILLHDHPKHPRLVRFLLLYPLYVLAELAIIATDLAELLGSAIGLTLLIPALPLSASVLLTALDVFVFLLIADNSHAGRPVRLVEIVIILLVAAVFVSFIVLVIEVNPVWSQVFLGFVPSKELFNTQPNAVYAAIGIVGATVMPHGLFLGSHFATQDRLSSTLSSPVVSRPSSLQSILRKPWRSMFSITRTSHDDLTDRSTCHALRQNNPLSFIRAHLTHAIVDIIFSLLVVAVPINSAILILSGAVRHDPSASSSVGIFSMYDLVLNTLGKGAAFLLALTLVLSGQAASITATFAGQVVSEGFILWNISPFLRRLLTRLLSLIPSMVVAMAFGRAGINNLLVASQVALSIVLPFVVFPLIFLTSSKTVMSVNAPKAALQMNDPMGQTPTIDSTGAMGQDQSSAPPSERSGIMMEEIEIIAIDKPVDTSGPQPHGDTIDFSNSYIVSAVAYAIWLVISVANVYGLVALALPD
ncbi:natural resistance-associated macrophage protein-domain-containing protein [Lanmaoa asiatica]|nr:natural resistance-associated macrophage protein-domain-containing protein [Lanmaoa asiatica]